MSQTFAIRENQIENAIIKICEIIEDDVIIADRWEDFDEERLWLELVTCILGSRVRNEVAVACATHLEKMELLEKRLIIKNPRESERKISIELNKSIYPPFRVKRGSKYRYPHSKANYIVTTCLQIYGLETNSIKKMLKESENGLKARERLIESCKGIGPKQASLFLRNISYCDSLAIIDSHVSRFLEKYTITKKYEDVVQENQHSYYKKESVLRLYAISKRKSLANLDRGIWIVMRAIQGGISL